MESTIGGVRGFAPVGEWSERNVVVLLPRVLKLLIA